MIERGFCFECHCSHHIVERADVGGCIKVCKTPRALAKHVGWLKQNVAAVSHDRRRASGSCTGNFQIRITPARQLSHTRGIYRMLGKRIELAKFGTGTIQYPMKVSSLAPLTHRFAGVQSRCSAIPSCFSSRTKVYLLQQCSYLVFFGQLYGS